MAVSASGTWNIDASHSSILFSIRHLVVAKVRGKLSRFSGVLELDETDLTRSRVNIAIDVASIDTSLEPRDAHLRSPDFFEVEKFPMATFASKAIERHGEEYAVRGDFTLHGITKEVTLKATFGGTVKDARGRERVAFEAKTTLDRAAFGLTWNQALEAGGWAIGATVELEIDVEAIKA